MSHYYPVVVMLYISNSCPNREADNPVVMEKMNYLNIYWIIGPIPVSILLPQFINYYYLLSGYITDHNHGYLNS